MVHNEVKQMAIACSVGVLVMIGITIGMILSLPIFIINEYFPVEYTKVFIIISIGISALIGALVAGSLSEDGGGRAIVFTISGYNLLLLFIAIFNFGGLTWSLFSNIIASVVCGFVGWFFIDRMEKTRPKRKKRGRYC